MQAARPKLEMELPYKMYRLVKADGTLCERIDKHPFAMSRWSPCTAWQKPRHPPCVGSWLHVPADLACHASIASLCSRAAS